MNKVGYCPLIKKCVKFAVTENNSVVCFDGGGIGETCEHMIVMPENKLQEFMNMSEEQISEYYGMVI